MSDRRQSRKKAGRRQSQKKADRAISKGRKVPTTQEAAEALPPAPAPAAALVPARTPAPARKQDRQKTLERYMDRMRRKPRAKFLGLANAYLSSYDIWSTVHQLEDCSRYIFYNVPAVHLMLYARSLGIPVRGVTSERRRKNGQYVCEERRGPHPVVYTGKYNYFSRTTTSPWAVTRGDIVYHEEDDESSEPTFVEYL
jgi:hypothetical protein